MGNSGAMEGLDVEVETSSRYEKLNKWVKPTLFLGVAVVEDGGSVSTGTPTKPGRQPANTF